MRVFFYILIRWVGSSNSLHRRHAYFRNSLNRLAWQTSYRWNFNSQISPNWIVFDRFESVEEELMPSKLLRFLFTEGNIRGDVEENKMVLLMPCVEEWLECLPFILDAVDKSWRELALPCWLTSWTNLATDLATAEVSCCFPGSLQLLVPSFVRSIARVFKCFSKSNVISITYSDCGNQTWRINNAVY